MNEVSIHPEAKAELEAAVTWYLERSDRAARRFVESFNKAVASIQEHPLSFPLFDDDHRFALLKKFPYCVVFRETPQGCRIVTVAHGRRRSGYWKGREELP